MPKRLQDFLIVLGFYFARPLIRLISFLTETQARFLVRLLYRPFSGFNRRVCRRNLAAFFPPSARGSVDLKRLHRAYLEYMVRFQEETGRCFLSKTEDLEKKIWMQGETHLQETLKKGNGALIVSGHMGTWWHIPALLARRGYKLNVVFNSFPHPSIEDYLQRKAFARYGIKLTFVDKGIPQMMSQAAKNNEIVYLTFDVAVRKRHTNWLPFGSTRININPGPAILALRYGMPALYASTCHCDAHRSHVLIHPEIAPGPAGRKPDARDLCLAWTERFYAEVLLHPEQWWGWGFSDLPRVRRQSQKVEALAGQAPAPASATPHPGETGESVCVT
jgi:KDO2-lipid IV(A) lauroyltransferase